MLVRPGLLGLMATCASGAYVQWQPCDGASATTDPLNQMALDASLARLENGDGERLSLAVGQWLEAAECENLARLMSSATLELEMLGRRDSFRTATNVTCERLHFSKDWVSSLENPVCLHVGVSSDVGFLPPLSTLHAILHLKDNASEETGCRQANITPALGSTATSVVVCMTWSIFIFVLLVGILRSAHSIPVVLDDGEQQSGRTVLPNVGDCLQYLQFIFLTGGLSLRYPGFYQPVVSNLGWFSLLLKGPITHGAMYDSVNDGIYEINGTYGGTFGLELMTQIIGAPMTMDAWVNMVVVMMIIAVGTAFIVEILWVVNRNRGVENESSPSATGVRHASSRVIRVILSYFMFPLVALSFYQLGNASFLPVYHTSLAVALIAAIMAAFVWLLRQIPTHSLGVLIFNNAKRYRQITPTESSRRQDETFILVLFVLCFVRGAAVGGLQICGPAQVAVLAACEVVLLAAIAGFQVYSMFSASTVAATVRLCTLILLICFLPDLATNDVKSVIGFALLAIHSCMLVFGFFVPAAFDLVKLSVSWWKAPRPEIYGLRQLRRRQVSRTSPDATGAAVAADTSYPEPDGIEEPSVGYHHPAYHQDSLRIMPLGDSTIPGRYYRSPRSPSRDTSNSSFDDHHGGAETTTSPVSAAYPQPRTVSTSSRAEQRSTMRSKSAASPARSSESTEQDGSSSTSQASSAASINSEALGPRWNDYSFREADLYYGAQSSPPAEVPLPPGPRPSSRFSSSELWAKFKGQSGPAEQGFVVTRPNRPSNIGKDAR